MLVGSDGNVREVWFPEDTSARRQECARDALKGVEFLPALDCGGRAVRDIVTLTWI
jgi:hypothetical protein